MKFIFDFINIETIFKGNIQEGLTLHSHFTSFFMYKIIWAFYLKKQFNKLMHSITCENNCKKCGGGRLYSFLGGSGSFKY